MTKNELNNRYFRWMCQLVSDRRYLRGRSYRRLLQFLHSVDFVYSIPMDGNREADGIDLRYRFGYENSYNDSYIALNLDDHPCSILEMMVALAIRCEENIMDDPDIGDRTGKWFWGMIENLGLTCMDDANYDQLYVSKVVEHFLNRDYKKNGRGGLFTVKHSGYDLRTVEIWCQMCWYLDELCAAG